jgi:hypothetical protein
VQTAAVLVLEPIFEADLTAEQYAYRADRSALDAVQHVHKQRLCCLDRCSDCCRAERSSSRAGLSSRCGPAPFTAHCKRGLITELRKFLTDRPSRIVAPLTTGGATGLTFLNRLCFHHGWCTSPSPNSSHPPRDRHPAPRNPRPCLFLGGLSSLL